MPDIPPELVAAAVAEAEQCGRDVKDVPLTAIAAAAGISLSTLVRRIGGSRRALDEAVRAAGIDPGGRPPVRERAIDAAAQLIGDQGLSAVTMESIASAAGCSLPSLHAAFGGRDGLLSAIFERYTPLLELEALMADQPDSVEATAHGILLAFTRAFQRERLVLPALMADVFARPDGPGRRVLAANFPRMLGTVGVWLTGQMQAGRFRQLPLPLAAQQLLGPIAIHMLTRPVFAPLFGSSFPTVEQACDAFAAAFLRSVQPASEEEGSQ